MRGETEIESGLVLELKASKPSISLSTNDDERSHEALNVEVSAQFLRVPDLPVLCFQRLTASRFGFGVFRETFAADRFCSGRSLFVLRLII